jgi:pSer/pThr/pTyr-binding forkhead associated (FHA) protein
MVPRITFEVTVGSLRGKRFVFKKPTHCLAGRAEDCSLRLSGSCELSLVSRHHCLLDIDPPRARVQDLGSRNGTFVNGRLIGQRARVEASEPGTEAPSAGYELQDGDELGLGPVILRVSIKGGSTAATSPPAPARSEA